MICQFADLLRKLFIIECSQAIRGNIIYNFCIQVYCRKDIFIRFFGIDGPSGNPLGSISGGLLECVCGNAEFCYRRSERCFLIVNKYMKGFYDIFCICSWFSGTGGYRACSRSMGDTDGERCVCFWNLHFQLWLIGELFVIVARSHCQSSDYGYKHFTCFHILIVLMNMIRTKNLCLLFQNKTNLNNYE